MLNCCCAFSLISMLLLLFVSQLCTYHSETVCVHHAHVAHGLWVCHPILCKHGGTGESQNREMMGMRSRVDHTQERGGFSSSACQILTPFLGPIYLGQSMWAISLVQILINPRPGTGLALGKGTNLPLPSSPSKAKTPLWDCSGHCAAGPWGVR